MKKLILLLFFFPSMAFAQTDSDTMMVELFDNVVDSTDSNGIDSFTIANRTEIDSLLEYAHQFLGVPYKYAGRDSNGFDCSGFVCHVYSYLGYDLPTSSSAQSVQGIPIKKDSIQPGDVLYFKGRNSKSKRVGHVAIAVKNEDGVITFIHASVNYGISLADTKSSYYKPRYLGARRIIAE